jgi:hypothetical protein
VSLTRLSAAQEANSSFRHAHAELTEQFKAGLEVFAEKASEQTSG